MLCEVFKIFHIEVCLCFCKGFFKRVVYKKIPSFKIALSRQVGGRLALIRHRALSGVYFLVNLFAK